MEWLESIFYGLSKGFWRAYFDVRQDRAKAEEEKPVAADTVRAHRFRDAVDGLRGKPDDHPPG